MRSGEDISTWTENACSENRRGERAYLLGKHDRSMTSSSHFKDSADDYLINTRIHSNSEMDAAKDEKCPF
jgi:hypothetical protein